MNRIYGPPCALAFCSSMLSKSLKGGLLLFIMQANVAELAIEKGASTLLIPISARRQLNDLSDEMAMKTSILFYADGREALIKALGD